MNSFGLPPGRDRTSYTTREELAGLLAADLLKTDIDYFTYHRITQVPLKRIPAKVLWSVAERYPFKLFEFRRTGILQFETLLADFDELYPAAYLSKLKAKAWLMPMRLMFFAKEDVFGVYQPRRSLGIGKANRWTVMIL